MAKDRFPPLVQQSRIESHINVSQRIEKFEQPLELNSA